MIFTPIASRPVLGGGEFFEKLRFDIGHIGAGGELELRHREFYG